MACTHKCSDWIFPQIAAGRSNLSMTIHSLPEGKTDAIRFLMWEGLTGLQIRLAMTHGYWEIEKLAESLTSPLPL
jgi:hypothetical protein